ncbi:unnamed protein product [Closterium sp. NIES-65]|nr:unnamed protein product [Closterium sp. NIES-65]
MYITLYYVVTWLPDSLRSVRDHFLSVCPTTLSVDLLKERLLAAEKSIVAVGASRGDPRAPVFEGCSPSPLLPSVASAAAVDFVGTESVTAASAPSGRRRTGKGKGGKGTGGGQRQQQQRTCETPSPQQLREWYAGRQRGGGTDPCTYVIHTGDRAGEQCGGPHSIQRYFCRLTDAWRHPFTDATEIPRWGELSRAGVAIFDLDYDAILVAMYAVSTSDEGDCYLYVPPDPGIEAAALGASASAASGAGEFALSGTTSAQALHTFTLDSGASRSFFRDRTTLTPLSRPVAVSMADPSGGPVLASFSTVLPCPAAPSGTLSGLYLPSFSTNLHLLGTIYAVATLPSLRRDCAFLACGSDRRECITAPPSPRHTVPAPSTLFFFPPPRLLWRRLRIPPRRLVAASSSPCRDPPSPSPSHRRAYFSVARTSLRRDTPSSPAPPAAATARRRLPLPPTRLPRRCLLIPPSRRPVIASRPAAATTRRRLRSPLPRLRVAAYASRCRDLLVAACTTRRRDFAPPRVHPPSPLMATTPPPLPPPIDASSVDKLQLAADRSAINWHSFVGSIRRVLQDAFVGPYCVIDVLLRRPQALQPTAPNHPGEPPPPPIPPGPPPTEPTLEIATTPALQDAADAAFLHDRREYLIRKAEHEVAVHNHDFAVAERANCLALLDEYNTAMADYLPRSIAWATADNRACTVLLGALPGTLMRRFQAREMRTSLIWAELQAMFERRDISSVGALFQEYFSITLATCDGAVDYVGRMQEVADRLAARQAALPEPLQIHRLLYNLTPDYDSRLHAFTEAC